jgi:oxygen-independent coproporphyrinogen-3 oxidase
VGELQEEAEQAGPGLYVHVPFCARVCPYCDFAVQTGGAAKRRDYLQALRHEIEGSAGEVAASLGGTFDTVYVGGGTPSALPPDALEAILGTLRRCLPVAADAEVSLEANPEDVTSEHLAAWRRLGVSRLSIGVQSFFGPALVSLGRAHSAGQGGEAVRRAVEEGFDSVSLDLIFAVPGGGAEAWELSLQHAVNLQPHHISCYELTLHEGTPLFREHERGRFVDMTGDAKAEQFFFTHEFLADAGYAAYEVSSFARVPAHRSRHNRKYWRHVPYLGLGPSAHSFDGHDRRWWNERRLPDWSAALARGARPVAESETLAPQQLALEALALGLRTTDGVDLERVARRWRIDLLGGNAELIDRLIAEDLLRQGRGSILAPTLRGMAVADSLAAAFEIPAPAPAATPAGERPAGDGAGAPAP